MPLVSGGGGSMGGGHEAELASDADIPVRSEPIIDLIRLNAWHYEKTQNPLFVWLTVSLRTHATASPEQFKFVDNYLARAAHALTRHMSSGKQKRANAIVDALEFKSATDFKSAALRQRAQTIYVQVEDLMILKAGTKVGSAIGTVAEQLGIEFKTAEPAYYQIKGEIEELLKSA